MFSKRLRLCLSLYFAMYIILYFNNSLSYHHNVYLLLIQYLLYLNISYTQQYYTIYKYRIFYIGNSDFKINSYWSSVVIKNTRKNRLHDLFNSLWYQYNIWQYFINFHFVDIINFITEDFITAYTAI